jgi:nucleoside-diphosphate-sugar epimerase
MRVFLAGATGAIGRQLLPLLVQAGHEVTAMTRSPTRAGWISSEHAQAVVCDIFDRERLRQALMEARPEVLIHQLTSIPKRIHPRRVVEELAATNRLRTEGTLVLMEAARAIKVRRVIAQSVSFFYNPNGGSAASESEGLFRLIPGASELVDTIHVHEHAVLGSPRIEGVVLRYGSFYGPGTSFAGDGSFANDVRWRRVPIVGEGKGRFSFIHVRDAAAVTAMFVGAGEPGIYNVVDNDPAAVADWLPYYAGLLTAKRPFRVPELMGRMRAGAYGAYMMTGQRGASNQKIKDAVGWKPAYASWREGFRAELCG